jgi:hypothetical protein
MNPTQLALARAAEAKLQEALVAVEVLSEHERTNPVAVSVAFRGLTRHEVQEWQARLNSIEAGTRTV